jgi:phosphatidylinositol 4-kinase B
MASHGLLLRLFLSPGFFTVNVALQYLAKYSYNIGITYYITRRLRNADLSELENIWGFVWLVGCRLRGASTVEGL